MSTTTLRHYRTTLSYTGREQERRIREFKRQFNTRISRRRAKQAIRQTLHKLHLV
jgi:hypothetical protein